MSVSSGEQMADVAQLFHSRDPSELYPSVRLKKVPVELGSIGQSSMMEYLNIEHQTIRLAAEMYETSYRDSPFSRAVLPRGQKPCNARMRGPKFASHARRSVEVVGIARAVPRYMFVCRRKIACLSPCLRTQSLVLT